MRGDENKGLSISKRLLMVFLGMVISINALLTVVYYVFSKNSIEKQTKERIFQQFEAIDHHFTYGLKDVLERELHVLASNPILDEFMMSSELEAEINARALERLFLESIQYTKGYQHISFVDYLGKEKVHVARTGRIRTYRDLGRSRLFTQIESDTPGSVHAEDLFTDKEGKVLFSIGIYKNDPDIGEFGGAVIIDYSLEEFLGYLDNIRILGENPIWVFAPDGHVLKQPLDKEAFFDPSPYISKGFQASPSFITLKKGILFYQDMSVTPGKPLIKCAISIPSSLLFKDIRSVLRFLFIVFFFSIIIIFIIVYYLSGYLSGPIVELANAAARLAKGDLSTQVKINTTGEVRMLVDSFNQMAKDLEKTTVSKEYLEKMVDERTKELRDVQKQLVRREKLAVLGQLAGGIGHELRNPLGVIGNSAYYLSMKLKDGDEKVEKHLSILMREVQRSNEIITDLLDYSRTKPPSIVKADIKDIVKEALTGVKIPENIVLETSLDIELPAIFLDPGQIRRVFLNFLTNAVGTMPEGGKLEIKAGMKGDFVEIMFRDTGKGIPGENLEKIFEPLFTTKAKGIGLGLAIVKSIVDRHNGEIEVESEIGVGTTFTVKFPF